MKDIDQKSYCSDYYDVSINMVLNAKHRQDFGKIKVGLMKWILVVGFSGILDNGYVEDQKMTKDKLIDVRNCE